MPIVEYSPANAGEWRNLNYVNTVDFDFNTVSNLLANNNQAVFSVSVATLQAMANVFGLNINNFVNTVMDLRWNQNPNQVLQVTINAVTINQNGIARITI